MTVHHTEDCIYSGQASELCDGTCTEQHEQEEAA